MGCQKSERTNSKLDKAKSANYVFISVMGPHANESEDEIFDRKANDIKKAGESFGVSKINQSFVDECRSKLNGQIGYLILVESSGNGKAAANTKTDERAKQYSEDRINWKDIDNRMSPVTGKLGNGTTAYYFDALELCDGQMDLDYYSESDNELKAIKFGLGHSNVFAKKKDIVMQGGMKSSKRKIVAVLRLKYPYIVWVK